MKIIIGGVKKEKTSDESQWQQINEDKSANDAESNVRRSNYCSDIEQINDYS